jgi:hypothetical protein
MLCATRESGDLASAHGIVQHRRIPHRILQSAFAAFIVLFYSKHLVSVMMRMALGACF